MRDIVTFEKIKNTKGERKREGEKCNSIHTVFIENQLYSMKVHYNCKHNINLTLEICVIYKKYSKVLYYQ